MTLVEGETVRSPGPDSWLKQEMESGVNDVLLKGRYHLSFSPFP